MTSPGATMMAALAVAAVGIVAIVLIDILLYFKLKSMFRYGKPPSGG